MRSCHQTAQCLHLGSEDRALACRSVSVIPSCSAMRIRQSESPRQQVCAFLHCDQRLCWSRCVFPWVTHAGGVAGTIFPCQASGDPVQVIVHACSVVLIISDFLIACGCCLGDTAFLATRRTMVAVIKHCKHMLMVAAAERCVSRCSDCTCSGTFPFPSSLRNENRTGAAGLMGLVSSVLILA
jgi:hypothetical protein